jgi:L-arabinose isomerase
MSTVKLKAGLFCIGLDTYWPQFDGLLSRLLGYNRRISEKLAQAGVEVTNAGMVDTAEKAADAAKLFINADVDALFLFISTYALSHNVLPLLQACPRPLIVLNLQPAAAIDYDRLNGMGDRGKMTGEWLAHCQACVTPELASVFNRAGIDFHLVTGYLEEDQSWHEIKMWIAALSVKKGMAANRLGVIGHYYNGMMDVYTDLTQQAVTFGTHIELIEFGVIRKFREEINEQEIKTKIAQFNTEFNVSEECETSELNRAARTAVALDKMIDAYQLGSLAYYYEGVGDPVYEDIITSVIPGFTLLTGHHVPVAGECEVKNAQAMKILDLFSAGGSFSEFYAVDFNDDVVLLGHDGPAHAAIAEGKVGLVPLPVYHGKPGKGLSIQMQVKNGPVTLLSVVQSKQGEIQLLCAHGKSVAGPTLLIGNTNSRYRFTLPARDFINAWAKAGPAHHCAIGTGHLGDQIDKLAKLLKISYIEIC